ncbi:hypothetical protein ACLKA7_005531 [Drosophila subpalustris]
MLDIWVLSNSLDLCRVGRFDPPRVVLSRDEKSSLKPLANTVQPVLAKLLLSQFLMTSMGMASCKATEGSDPLEAALPFFARQSAISIACVTFMPRDPAHC